mmetsp:Transcript_37491/g.88081  ORF Transcript_37491/g.88081 Transcript_37491/m.88081 type:complete len:433 (+) Transcript_37491:46-1344(+)|eukprot:s4185_g8.t1
MALEMREVEDEVFRHQQACIKNTFLEFFEETERDDEDPWVIQPDPRRWLTDSAATGAKSRAPPMTMLATETGSPSFLRRAHPKPGSDRSWDGHSSVETYTGSAAGSAQGSGPCSQMTPEARFVSSGSNDDFSYQGMLLWPEDPHAVGAAHPYSHPTAYPGSAAEVFGHFAPDALGEPYSGSYAYGTYDWSALAHEDVESQVEAKKPVDPEILRAREVALAGNGLSRLTTAMIRNVPSKYTQQKLMREINDMGFLGKFDFFYLPMQPHGRGNRGFAFINFMAWEAAQEFYMRLHNRPLRLSAPDTPAAIMPADLQGFERNAEHYANMRLSRSSRRPLQCGRALFFRPLPEHIHNVEGSAAKVVSQEDTGWTSHETRSQKPSKNEMNQSIECSQASSGVRRFCAYCGTPMSPEHSFCGMCGKRAADGLCPPQSS